ncbi:hypothetical protein WGT02_30355 (plasmid) [Rhizobium sp. T1470]|uniref:hypothetical protein n=1 Tax=unclassified Rhizobium TaxID=2613769 RepID=UPI0030CEF9E5
MLDSLQAFAHRGETLDDAAEIGAVIDRRSLPLELVEGGFDALADRRHFSAEVGGKLSHCHPQVSKAAAGSPASPLGECFRLQAFPILLVPGRGAIVFRHLSSARASTCQPLVNVRRSASNFCQR